MNLNSPWKDSIYQSRNIVSNKWLPWSSVNRPPIKAWVTPWYRHVVSVLVCRMLMVPKSHFGNNKAQIIYTLQHKTSRRDSEKEVLRSCPISLQVISGYLQEEILEASLQPLQSPHHHPHPSPVTGNWLLISTCHLGIDYNLRSFFLSVLGLWALNDGKYGSPVQMTSPASLIGSWYMDGKAKLTGACYVLIIIGCCRSGFERTGFCCWECKVLDFSVVLIMGQEILYKAAQQSRAPC